MARRGSTAASKTRHVTCAVCSARTTMPAENPPFGTALICEKCRSPLVATLTRQGAPLTTPGATLGRTTGYTGRCLIHPCCAWCGAINYAIVAPEEARSTSWHTQTGEGSGHAFSLAVECVRCGKRFFAEWDEPPLQAQCALCRTSLRRAARSAFDPRFCVACGASASQVHERRKGAPAPGDGITATFLVGFGRTPGVTDVRRVRRVVADLADATPASLMMSGRPPDAPVECALVALQVAAETAGRSVRRVEAKRVAYQRVHDLLLVTIWK